MFRFKMEDGYLPAGLGIFAVIIAVAAILYGFEKALFALSEGTLERKAEEEDNAKAKKLLKLIEKENRFFYGVRTAHLILGIVLGANVLLRTYRLAQKRTETGSGICIRRCLCWA